MHFLSFFSRAKGTNGALNNIITNNDDNDDNDNIVPPTVTASPASSVRPDLVRLYSVSGMDIDIHCQVDSQCHMFSVVVHCQTVSLKKQWY